MPRQRNIKPGFFTNDRLSDCSPLARILFAGLWTIADREGRLECRLKKIKAECLPYDDCNIEKLLQELHPEFILIYMVDGVKYIQILSWSRHQTPHKNEPQSLIPQPTPTNSGAAPEPVGLPCPTRVVETETETETEMLEKGDSKGENKLAREQQVDTVVDHYRKHHHKARPGRLERNKIRDRLLEGWTVDELCGAIDGNHRDPHCCGQNDRGREYHALELCVRDSKHVQQYLEVPIRAGPVLSEKTRRTIAAGQAWLERKEREDANARPTPLLPDHGSDGECVSTGGRRADAGGLLDGIGGADAGAV